MARSHSRVRASSGDRLQAADLGALGNSFIISARIAGKCLASISNILAVPCFLDTPAMKASTFGLALAFSRDRHEGIEGELAVAFRVARVGDRLRLVHRASSGVLDLDGLMRASTSSGASTGSAGSFFSAFSGSAPPPRPAAPGAPVAGQPPQEFRLAMARAGR